MENWRQEFPKLTNPWPATKKGTKNFWKQTGLILYIQPQRNFDYDQTSGWIRKFTPALWDIKWTQFKWATLQSGLLPHRPHWVLPTMQRTSTALGTVSVLRYFFVIVLCNIQTSTQSLAHSKSWINVAEKDLIRNLHLKTQCDKSSKGQNFQVFHAGSVPTIHSTQC